MLGFARTLRHAGVTASPDRVEAMLERARRARRPRSRPTSTGPAGSRCAAAPTTSTATTPPSPRTSPARRPRAGRAVEPAARQQLAATAPLEPGSGDGDDDAETPDLAAQASADEVLRHRDVAELTVAEREHLRRLFALLAPATPMRPSRRRRPSPRGAVHPARTVRRALRDGGEVTRLLHRRRQARPRRVVLLVDVSGSMAPYADALLRFAHAAVRARPAATEVFTIGTRLTRVTREMRLRDPDKALAASGSAIPDWSGGTRLGEVLKAFLDRWGQRGTARGAVSSSAATAGSAAAPSCSPSRWPGCGGWRTPSSG